jgi:hypothetical protein
MKLILPLLAALILSLGATSAIFADDNMDPPDVLQKNRGPGNLDANTKPLNKNLPVPTPTPVPKAPEKKKLGY